MSSPSSRASVDSESETVGYRAVMRLPAAEEAIGLAERHVRTWLRTKVSNTRIVDDWDGSSSTRFDKHLSIKVVNRDDEQSGIRRRLFRLLDHNPGGRFTVSVFAASPPVGQPGAIIVEAGLAGSSRDDALDKVGTPRIVSEILNEVSARDGDTPLTGSPVRVHFGDAQAVLDAITDEGRHISVIVASSVDRNVDHRWAKIVSKLTRNSVGVAAVYSVDADAVDELNTLLPNSHSVPAGLVRTFAPGVDLNDPDDGRIHRFLGPQTLARAIRGERVVGRLPEIHAQGPRLRLLERPLPTDIRRAMNLLQKEERKERLELEVARRLRDSSVAGNERLSIADAPVATEPAATPSPIREERTEAGIVRRLRASISRWLGREDSEVTAKHVDGLDHFVASKIEESRVAAEYVEEVEEANKALEDQIAELRDLLDERELSASIIAAELRDESTENQLLKRQLREQHVFHVAVDPDADRWQAPDDVEELVTWITPGEGSHFALNRVVFTGDAAAVSEVRKRDSYGTYASAIWDYIRVLYEYADARAAGYAGNVHMYLTDETASGFKCSPQRHAGRESDSVRNNAKWSQERVLPIPVEAVPEGEIFMEAHFKPTHRDQFAPRVHYYDDTDNTGRVYVGYIGRHLTNTHT